MSLGLIHLHVVMRKYAVEAIIKYSELERNNATPQRSAVSIARCYHLIFSKIK